MSAENKKIVTRFYEELFSHGNKEVIDELVGTTYINHNPQGVDGPEGIKNFITFFRETFPERTKTTHRVLAEDDLVLLHTESAPAPGATPSVVVDIYRVEDGKIVEHWDVIQEVPGTVVGGHDLFTTISEPAVSHPDPDADTAESKKVVTAVFHGLAVEKDPTVFERYAVDSFIEHNPQHADGVAAATELFTGLFAGNPEVSIDVKRVIAEGDYVAVHHHLKLKPADRGFACIEFFRVREGKIVEHWDAVQAVPETSANDNTMF
ncbi:nuclear transport factor 2 family protein [Streptomyces griseorubiginosus]|uniref:nuclear transport factor 2 family protein n=1 Tax=Streptomyces griseorubiginosus TaxID=67304 RepID=UPI001FCA6283|nr:nuclear transport factor 2 family protein [Streptomyces griseorubiginosus]